MISASLGGPSEFGVIFARHHIAVLRFAARRIGVQEAQDIASEVFIRAFRVRHRYDASRSNCLPWLYGMAGNVIGDRLRKIRRSQRVYLVADPESATTGPHEDADDRVVANSVAVRLNDALRQLSRRDRDTLLLYALEGLTYAEIGRVLDVPSGTVGSRIARARSQISELIPDLEQRTNPMVQTEDQEADRD